MPIRPSRRARALTLLLIGASLGSGCARLPRRGLAAPGRPGRGDAVPLLADAADRSGPGRVRLESADAARDLARLPADGPSRAVRDADGDEEVDGDLDLTRPRAGRAGEGGGPTAAAEEEGRDEDFPKSDLLVRALHLEGSPLKLYGWVQGDFEGNPRLSSDGANFGITPGSLANRFLVPQVYLVAEKPVRNDDALDFGFRLDSLAGTDWQVFHSAGLFEHAFAPNSFGYDPVQMYAEVHLPILTRGGVDIKGGRFYALPGYEDGQAPARPLMSTGYLFNYAHPFTHFGTMSVWHVTDQLNLYSGVVNGWDRWINRRDRWGYAGGAGWDSADGRTNLTLTVNYGPNQLPALGAPNPFGLRTSGIPPGLTLRHRRGRRDPDADNDLALFTAVLVHEWTDDFSTVLEADEGFESGLFRPSPGPAAPGGPNHSATYYGLSGWALYELTDHLTGVARAEVFRDNDGIRTGFDDTFYEATIGLIYKPRPWLWLRPEARYDWADRAHPFDDGHSRDQFTLGFDVIFLF
jgi:hypothetical protein